MISSRLQKHSTSMLQKQSKAIMEENLERQINTMIREVNDGRNDGWVTNGYKEMLEQYRLRFQRLIEIIDRALDAK